MPRIDPETNSANRPRVKPRRTKVRRSAPSSHPRPRGTTRTFTPKGKPRPAAPRPKPAPYTLPPKFRTEGNASQGHRPAPREKSTVKANIEYAKNRHKRDEARQKKVIRKASERFGVKGQREAQKRAIGALSDLRASNPRAYEDNLRNAESWTKKLSRMGGQAQRVTDEASTGVKHAIDEANRIVEHRGKHEAHRETMGPDLSTLGKEAADIVAQTPSGAYMTADAAVKAAKGDTKPARKLWKDYKKTSAIPALVSGHPGEALKRASERPLTTALELQGAKSLIGRTSGAVARHAIPSERVKNYANTTRAPKRLYPGSEPGEGPAIGRRYSKDLINNRIQKAADRRKVRKGQDPNVVTEHTVPNLAGGPPVKATPNVGLMKHPLDDRVDRHVHAAHVMTHKVVHTAEKAAAKEAKAVKKGIHKLPEAEKPKPLTKAQEARTYTERQVSVGKLNMRAVANQAHDVLGIEKPVRIKPMTKNLAALLEKRLGKVPRGYTNPSDTHYTIHVNLDHPENQGPRGVSNVVHYELGRVQGEEMGIKGPGAVGSKHQSYHDNPNTQHAKKVMREHIATDLRNEPRLPAPDPVLPPREFTGTERPTPVDEAGQLASRAATQSHMHRVLQDFSILPEPKGPAKTFEEVMLSKAHHEERLGMKLIPVNAERLMRMPQEPPLPRNPREPHQIRIASAQERAWREATDNHAPGKWVLMPQRVVNRFIQHAENSRNYGALQRSANQFKDVALTTSNPIRWLGGNVTDLTMRTAFEGLTPVDLYRGVRVGRELSRFGRKGELVKASTMGGGFGHLARDIANEVERPAVKSLAKVWHKYRTAVYAIESAIEAVPQVATVGKEMRMTPGPTNLRAGLHGLLRATDEQVQHFAKNMVADRATEMRVARHVEDVIGSWGKLSPEARKMLVGAPFAQWLGASTRYVLVTLPVKHPIKTGILAAISEMTEKERMALGFSRFLPLKDQVQDYQMMTLPQHVGKDKYGPVVKGTDMARATSMGTVNDAMGLNVGGFLFPQFMGALNAAQGTSWTGEPMVYAEGKPNAGMQLSVEDRRKVAIGMLAEAMVPGASTYRRVIQEGGRPSMPQSTILTPEVRQKWDAKNKKLVTPPGSTGQGLKRFAGWPIPGLPSEKRVFTKGAVTEIGRHRIQGEENRKSNEKRKAERKKATDTELEAFGTGAGKPKVKRKVADPELEAFK